MTVHDRTDSDPDRACPAVDPESLALRLAGSPGRPGADTDSDFKLHRRSEWLRVGPPRAAAAPALETAVIACAGEIYQSISRLQMSKWKRWLSDGLRVEHDIVTSRPNPPWARRPRRPRSRKWCPTPKDKVSFLRWDAAIPPAEKTVSFLKVSHEETNKNTKRGRIQAELKLTRATVR